MKKQNLTILVLLQTTALVGCLWCQDKQEKRIEIEQIGQVANANGTLLRLKLQTRQIKFLKIIGSNSLCSKFARSIVLKH